MGQTKHLIYHAVIALCTISAMLGHMLGQAKIAEEQEILSQAREARIMAAIQQKAWARSIQGMSMHERLDIVRLLVTEEETE